jgi:hypothetical protein
MAEQELAGSDSQTICSFNCGRLNVVSGTAKADPRKGNLSLRRTLDGLMSLCWKDRSTEVVEEELFVMPGDATMKLLPQKGRVYVLEFSENGGRKVLFWSQEKDPAVDEAAVKRINSFLAADQPSGQETPATSQTSAPAAGGASAASATVTTPTPDLATANLATLDPNVFMQMMTQYRSSHGLGPAVGLGHGAGSSHQSRTPEQLADLRAQYKKAQEANLGLMSEVFASKHMLPILARLESSDEAAVGELQKLLPEGLQNQEELNTMAMSPQFQQAVEAFAGGVQTGLAGPLLAQFGITDAGPGVSGLLDALVAHGKRVGSKRNHDQMQNQ